MKPRIFVSSTYYDLKHVRERIEKFIDNYGFESVLFESDRVTYDLEKPIDESAYNEVTLCHIMILIIGGRYGTSVSSGNSSEEIKKYEEEYVSITRREFETAVLKNIPVFVFVDKNVYSEYETFKENQDFLDRIEDLRKKDKSLKFKFAHVDSVSIFKFIDIVKSKPIKTFDKVEQIETYLQNQIAGLFYLYLDSLQKQKEVQKVLDSVQELNNISLRMNEMLNSVGKKILGHDNQQEYEVVITKQLEMIIDFFANQFYDMFKFEQDEDHTEVTLEAADFQKITELLYSSVLENKVVVPDFKSRIQRARWINEYNEDMFEKTNALLLSINVHFKVTQGQFYRANVIYHKKLEPFIRTAIDKQMLLQRLQNEVFLLF